MLVTTLSTPTPFGYWGYSLVGHVLDAVYGGHRRIHCLDLAQLREGWSEEKDKPVLVTSDRPDTALSYLLITSNFPMLAFFDGPRDALAYAVLYDKLSLTDAIRFCSGYFSALVGCTGSEHVRVFGPAVFDRPVHELIEAIFAVVGAEADRAQVAAVTERVIGEAELGREATVGDVLRRRFFDGQTLTSLGNARFDADERRLVDWFEVNYGPMLAGQETEAMDWPLAFFGVDANADKERKVIELIGGARHIIWGPYLHLPLGAWRARVEFEVVGNLSGNEIEADVIVAMTQIAKCNSKLPVHGYFQFALDFVVANPSAPVEIRVRLMKSAIEGRFSLRRVALTPIARPEESARASLTAQIASPQGTPA